MTSIQLGTYRTGWFQLNAMIETFRRFRMMPSTPITPATRTSFTFAVPGAVREEQRRDEDEAERSRRGTSAP